MIVKPSDINTSDFSSLLGKSELEQAAKKVVQLCIDNNDSWETEIPTNDYNNNDRWYFKLLEQYGWLNDKNYPNKDLIKRVSERCYRTKWSQEFLNKRQHNA